METYSTSDRIASVFFEYATRIAQEQDTDTLLRLNADMARDLVGADRCSIWLVDTEAGQLFTTVAHGVGQVRINIGHGLAGACVASGKPVMVNDTSSDERFLGRVDHASGYVTHSVLVIPLRTSEGKVIGAFQALNKPGGFSEEDIALLGLAGSYSAAAIETQRLRKEAETARLLMREIAIAREVQLGLLPPGLPDVDGLECAAFFRPAKLVGGDYYDFIRMPDGSLAFTLGDVSGKGVPAAVLMASIQASLRMGLLRDAESLTTLVADLNESVHTSMSSMSSGYYSTLFCGVIRPDPWRLAYVNAGQWPPIIVRGGQQGPTLEHLDATGTPVGMLPMAQYEDASTTLERGDILVCFSDGISEARNSKGEFWDESEIDVLLSRASGANAQEVTDRLVRAADAFAGGSEQADDMTVVALRVL